MVIFTQHLENAVSENVKALIIQQIWEEQNLLPTQILNLAKLFPSIWCSNCRDYFHTQNATFNLPHYLTVTVLKFDDQCDVPAHVGFSRMSTLGLERNKEVTKRGRHFFQGTV